jgi:3-hydroxybutyryl-CoA dehydrogenase
MVMIQIDQVKRILIVGAGTMGHQIGFLCAQSGFDTVIYDPHRGALEETRHRIARLADRFVRKGRLPEEKRDAAIGRIVYTDQAAEAARDVDVVSESIPEDPGLKGELFRSLHPLCPARTVFTTNTSMLVPSMFAEATGRPDRFLAWHFHDVLLSDMVDVMPHPGTAAWAIALIQALSGRIGQKVILLERENYGYIFNSMLGDVFRSALTLASNRVASPEQIDRAWMGVMHTAAGPFGMMDGVGLDTVWKITAYWAGRTQDPQSADNAAFLKRMVDGGRLGVKSGGGFYNYPAPRYQQPDFI